MIRLFSSRLSRRRLEARLLRLCEFIASGVNGSPRRVKCRISYGFIHRLEGSAKGALEKLRRCL
jgi:hypothetical protein